MSIHPRIKIVAVILTTFLLTACVEFTEQRLTYNVEDNELTIFQEYRGIYAKDINLSGKNREKHKKKTKLTAEEQKDIDSVINGERTFFFSNWIMEYNRAHLEKELVKYNEEKLSPEEIAERSTWIPLIELLLANVKVTNGDFYFDEKQRLSGYQIVRVKNVDQLITEVNSRISKWILQTKPTENGAEIHKKKQEMAKAGHQWVKQDRNRFTISYPASAQEYDELKQESSGYTGNSKPPITTAYSDGIATIDIGTADAAFVVISKVMSDTYSPVAVDYISSKYQIKNDLDIDGIKQSLFKTSDQAAVDKK